LHAADHRARHGGEKLAHLGQHHVLDAAALEHTGQLVGKHVHHHQGARAGVVELVNHLALGVERVGVDQHAPGLEHTKRHHRVGQAVGHLHRHPVTGLQLQHLAQVAGESV
jgi:hypothetical protein